jgi:hypothetical protein
MKSFAFIPFLIVFSTSLITGCGKRTDPTPVNEPELKVYPVVGCNKPECAMDIVFIHGVDGDHLATWHPSNDEKAYWPKWIGEDLSNVGVWSINYPVATTFTGETMSLIDRGTSIIEALVAEGFSESPERPLVFICHSFGGLVTKQILETSYNSNNSKRPHAKTILNRCNGVVLIATPNSGADIADFLGYLNDCLGNLNLISKTVDDLERGNDYLLKLNRWYRDHSAELGIDTLVFAEERRTTLLNTRTIQVVTKESADPGIPGVTPIPVDADHLTICKPKTRDELLYKQILRFLKNRMQTPSPAVMPDPTGPIEKGGAVDMPSQTDVDKSPTVKAEDVVLQIKNRTSANLELAMFDWSRHFAKQNGVWSYVKVRAGQDRLFESFETKTGATSVGSTGWFSLYMIKPDNSVTRCLSTENFFNARQTSIIITERDSDLHLEIKVDE